MTERNGNRRAALKVGRLLLVGALFLVALAPYAMANTYTYTYTGNRFWYIGGCCGVNKVTGYFTLPSPLASDTTYNLKPDTELGGTILNYDFTDGRNTWDLANFVAIDSFGNTSRFSITTGNGDIVAWNFNIDDYTGPIIGWPCPGYPYCTGGAINTQWTGTAGSDGTNVYGNYDAYSYFPNQWTGLGTWTGPVTPSVPEPASFLLLGTGLLGLGRTVVRRKRRG